MNETTAIVLARSVALIALIPRQADSDEQLVALWLHGRSPRTQRAYRDGWQRFHRSCPLPLQSIRLIDLQGWANTLAAGDLAIASQSLLLSAVKSLFAFAHRLGYIAFDVGRVLKLPKQRETLAERILSEAQVHKLIAHETDARNVALLKLAYCSGARLSELATLCWKDTQPRGEHEGQITVFGKGGKTRTILLPASVWSELQSLRNDAGGDAPVFTSREGGPLGRRQIQRIVRSAAKRAGLRTSSPVSPHWLRHAHASHSLDRGAPISLVASTLGHSNVSTTGRYLHARPNDSSSRYLAI